MIVGSEWNSFFSIPASGYLVFLNILKLTYKKQTKCIKCIQIVEWAHKIIAFILTPYTNPPPPPPKIKKTNVNKRNIVNINKP